MRYNSFSGIKGLTWFKNYENIVNWTTGKTKTLLPPIGVTIDLTTGCNLHCRFCNAFRSWNAGKTLDTEEVFKMIDMLKNWRGKRIDVLRSCCFAGGGEPTLHPRFAEIIKYARDDGFQVGISTNGLQFGNKEIRKAIIEHAEFCGISLDSGSKEVWSYIKNVKPENYDVLISGIKKLIKDYNDFDRNPRKCDIVYKFLITKDNQYDILNGAKLAKELGFKTFYVRPAAMAKLEIFGGKDQELDVKKIMEQLESAKKLENDFFIVDSSFNRVNEKLGIIHNFKKCWATPILAQFCADGCLYSCIDCRYIERHKQVHWTKVRKYWSSKGHRDFINNININDCVRCAQGNFNEQIEKAYLEDSIYRWFP